MNLQKVKKRIFEIIQIGNGTDTPSLLFDGFIVVVILLNIFITLFETFEQFEPYADVLRVVEFITILIFTVEYALRIWTAEYLYPDKQRLYARIRFLFSFYGVVDIMTILPYFLPFVFPSGAVAFRMLRVVRILRLFRINSRYDAFNVITNVLYEKKNQLMSSMFLVLVLMLASSLCMYSLEHEAQPEAFSNAFSGIWWAVSTLLTVGYGDIYPITVGGRITAIIIAFLGVGMVAIPTGIISAGFVEYYTRIKSGEVAKRDADFVTLDITEKHSYAGKHIKDLGLPRGLYAAVVVRGKTVCLAADDLELCAGDRVLLGTASQERLEARLEELTLERGHIWIGREIQSLDISRQSFVVMVKRKGKNLQPRDDMRLKEGDVVLTFYRRY